METDAVSHFSVVLQSTNNNFGTSDQIFMKFGVDVVFQTGSCQVIQLYSPNGANTQARATRVGMHVSYSMF